MIFQQEENEWDSTYLLCKNGKQQSPIDIQPSAAIVVDGAPSIAWQPSPARSLPVALIDEEFGQRILDLRTALRPALALGGVRYTLRDMVLHAPSEHALNGIRFDAELQLVHVAPGPRCARPPAPSRASRRCPVARRPSASALRTRA